MIGRSPHEWRRPGIATNDVQPCVNQPLGTACNETVAIDVHPRSCEFAWAAQAAHRQNKFWLVHNALFDSDLARQRDSLPQLAQDAGLDLARFEADRQSPATKAAIEADIHLGRRLGVNSVPSVFLNGRRIHHLNAETLTALVRHELNRLKR